MSECVRVWFIPSIYAMPVSEISNERGGRKSTPDTKTRGVCARAGVYVYVGEYACV